MGFPGEGPLDSLLESFANVRQMIDAHASSLSLEVPETEAASNGNAEGFQTPSEHDAVWDMSCLDVLPVTPPIIPAPECILEQRS